MEQPTQYNPRQLLEGISAEANSHIGELSIDLNQLRKLLNDAIDEICCSFAEISAEASLPSNSNIDSEEKQRLTNICARSNEVLTGLQFHDLASQIISRADARLEGLAGVVQGITRIASKTEGDDAALVTEMRTLQQHSQALRIGLQRKVLQNSLVAGGIEIF